MKPAGESNASTRRIGILALIVAALSSVSGCGKDHPTLAPARGGVIRGLVSDGSPMDDVFTVYAESVGQAQIVYVEDYVDLAGRFALRVPNGKYRVGVRPPGSGTLYYSVDGPVLRYAEADTVRVGADEQDLAFACGRLAFDIGLPASAEGSSMYCSAEAADPTGYARECSGYVDDGLRRVVRFVPPGRYRLAIGGGDLSRTYLPPTFDREVADQVDVVVGQESVYSHDIEAFATLSGSVTGSWQAFGARAPRIYASYGGQSVGRGVAAADGSFVLRFLAGAPLRLQIRIDDLAQWIGGRDLESATIFDLEAGGAITGVDYVESGLECVLTGDRDDRGVIVEVYDADRASRGVSWLEGDTLRIPNLQPGPAYMEIRPASSASLWLSQYFDRRDSLAVADPIEIPPGGQVAHIVAPLVRGGRIRGRILHALGLPPEANHLEIAIYAAADSLEVIGYYYAGSAAYDETTGDYVLNQIHDGTYKLRARAQDVWTWWPSASSFAAAGAITVENHADVDGVDWQLID